MKACKQWAGKGINYDKPSVLGDIRFVAKDIPMAADSDIVQVTSLPKAK